MSKQSSSRILPVGDSPFMLLKCNGMHSQVADSQVGGGKDHWLENMQPLLKARQTVGLLSQAREL